MVQHRIANHEIVTLLVEEELSPMAELRVRLAILVRVRCWGV